ncbi:hypothetical protein [Streptomyces sp. PvR034]|uniref:hypothetical protein n=1 Tax=Streptomyces sp. PvR034 TaxID=3156401 RepID=UPI0033931965
MVLRRALAALGVAGSLLAFATPAEANQNPCPSGIGGSVACFYYSPYLEGAYHVYYQYNGNVPDQSGDKFGGYGAGSGQGVRNNAASVQNTSSSRFVFVYYSPNYGGPNEQVNTNDWINLVNLRNNNASFKWL